MKKKSFLSFLTTAVLILLVQSMFVSCNKDENRLVIITFDGLRWQEVFTGADSMLVGDTTFVADTAALQKAYWRATPEERRAALMPFVWGYVAERGYLIGNKNKDSRMTVSNSKRFSYPGYSEMFCGWADDERVTSNEAVENPNTNVLEVVNKDPRYAGSVMMLSSWLSIRYAIANERAGIPGSSAFDSCYVKTPATAMLERVNNQLPKLFGDGERLDDITCGYALEVLKNKHPKVFYVGYGDTDEFGHEGHYDKYLDAAHNADDYIRMIVETCEADPFYKDKTTYLVTCDHGRGRGEFFTDHGADVRGAEETWVMVFGKDVPVLGETTDNGPFYTKQLAATIASVLNVKFTPDNGDEELKEFDPTYYKAPEKPVASAKFNAVEANPKGQGLSYTYSEGDFMNVESVVAAPVKAKGISPIFTTSLKKREDHFGIVLKGLMKVPATGLYLFSLASDDGSKLWLDGKELWDMNVDGGGLKEDWLELEAGYHRLEVQYFENYGSDKVEVGLQGNGLDYINLPEDMLYHE